MQNISRILVGIVTVPIVIAIIFYLPISFFIALVMMVIGLGLYEYFPLARVRTFLRWKGGLAGVGMAFPLAAYYWGIEGMVGGLLGVMVLSMLLAMGSLVDYEDAFLLVGGVCLGYLFVAVPLSFAVPIFLARPYGRDWALWMVLVIWAGDTGAFYLGTLFGRHKLYPKVSPKKSLEGIVGGAVSALFVGLVSEMFLHTGFSSVEMLVLPPVLLLLGQAGDFSESMLKRGAGVKDSSRILGGHGGVLDRVDSFLFTIPFFYFYLFLRA